MIPNPSVSFASRLTRALSAGWRLCCACMLLATPLRSGEIQETEGALWKVSTSDGKWNGGLRAEAGARKASFPEGEWDVDTRRVTGRIGRGLGRAAHVWAEAGAAWADREGRGHGTSDAEVSSWIETDADGDPGPAWGLGGGVVVLRKTLKDSPVLGRLEWVELEVQASHREANSDLPPVARRYWDADAGRHLPGAETGESAEASSREFTWRDSRITPMLIYRRDRTAEGGLAPFALTGYAVRGGISWFRTRMEYPGRSDREDHGFGVEVGADFRLRSGWVCRLEGLFLESSQRRFSLSVLRFF